MMVVILLHLFQLLWAANQIAGIDVQPTAETGLTGDVWAGQASVGPTISSGNFCPLAPFPLHRQSVLTCEIRVAQPWSV